MDKREISKTIREVLAFRHPYVVRAEIFGSFARGDNQTDSDVDLILTYDDTRPRGFRTFGLHRDLELSIGRKVDIVEEHLLHDFVREHIRDDRDIIYVRQELRQSHDDPL
ncbi:MAG: nucleotidyltransferase domain-containing protein [Candidatus Adiutrix sp.]|jgi:predicted nucleotidyltransferase|nr:nucleotidyltransferase domain-containing protein [Candidatus Adiutrix sp.]